MLVIINCFIVAYVVFAWGWTAPASAPLAPLRERSRRWVVRLGLSHAWNMFAPDPVSITRYAEVVVTLDDGRIVAWRLEPDGRRGMLSRMLRIRRRKYQSSLFGNAFPSLRLALFAYVGRDLARSGVRAAAARLDCIEVFPPALGAADGSERPPRRRAIAEHVFG